MGDKIFYDSSVIERLSGEFYDISYYVFLAFSLFGSLCDVQYEYLALSPVFAMHLSMQ